MAKSYTEERTKEKEEEGKIPAEGDGIDLLMAPAQFSLERRAITSVQCLHQYLQYSRSSFAFLESMLAGKYRHTGHSADPRRRQCVRAGFSHAIPARVPTEPRSSHASIRVSLDSPALGLCATLPRPCRDCLILLKHKLEVHDTH